MARRRNPLVHTTLDWKSFGARLLTIRKFSRLSEDDVAAKCHIGHVTVHRAENGKPVSATAMLVLCDFMNANPKEFLVKP